MRGEYSTRQKREMLQFLLEHEMMHFTVDEFVQAMEEQGLRVGRTTAYRFLESLSDQAGVRKYLSPTGQMLYQSVPAQENCDRHFHLMCSRCGCLLHVDCEMMQELIGHLRDEHDFRVDPRQSVLVGVCAKCAEEGRAHGAD